MKEYVSKLSATVLEVTSGESCMLGVAGFGREQALFQKEVWLRHPFESCCTRPLPNAWVGGKCNVRTRGPVQSKDGVYKRDSVYVIYAKGVIGLQLILNCPTYWCHDCQAPVGEGGGPCITWLLEVCRPAAAAHP